MSKKVMSFFVLIMHGALFCMEIQKCYEQEVYDRYHCDPVRTKCRDDFLECVKMRRSLFMQLYVQTSRPSDIGGILRINYLRNLRRVTIKGDNDNPGYVMMTEKDLFYRLLTGIPRNDVYSLVNGKKVRLSLHYYPINVDTKGMVLLADYCFEEDRKHHQKIVQKFNELRPQQS